MQTHFLQKIILLFIITPLLIFSQESERAKLRVGTKIAEPFVIKNSHGNWSGITFELWNKIANDLNIDYTVKEYDLEGLIRAVKNNEIDIAVSPLTITAEREKKFDFTHPYYVTGLSIAVLNKEEGGILKVFSKLMSTEFMEILLLISTALFIVGFVTWLFERKKNKEQFGDGVSKGLGSSFWWAAVTMTTVGYGDKAPRTVGGRMVALIWMFAGLVIISSFTAAIASALTVTQLDSSINSVSDLYKVRVATISSSSSEEYLLQNNISYTEVNSVQEGINKIANGNIDAMVYDAPLLKYLIKKNDLSNKIKVLPITLDPLYYGFALQNQSNLREPINLLILKETETREWKKILNSYLGF